MVFDGVPATKVSTKLLVCSFPKQISNLLVIKQETPVQHAGGEKKPLDNHRNQPALG